MKKILLLSLVSMNALSVEIPIEPFDQSKLETLLRRIPTALIGTTSGDGFVKKTTRYPDAKSLFAIVCEADYFGGSDIPTNKSCKVTISDKSDLRGDEYLIKITDSRRVTEMYNAIPFGLEIKKSYSHERIYGQAWEGDYKNIFRFMIVCKKTSCDFRFSPKEAL